jgi:hypothetical protein
MLRVDSQSGNLILDRKDFTIFIALLGLALTPLSSATLTLFTHYTTV